MATKTISPTKDAFMEGIVGPDTNYGGNALCSAQVVYAAGDKAFIYRTVVNFDVSAVAADTINAVSLWMYHETMNGSAGHVSRNKRYSTWVENQVTWNDFSTGNAWDTGGGDGAGDIDDVTPTEVTFTFASSSGWQEVTGLKGHVDDAISLRSNIVALNVHLADQDPGATAGNNWHGKDYPGNAHYLAIDYTPASPAGIPFIRPSNATRALLRR